MKPPIQANFVPTNVVNAPTTPRRAPRPSPNSAMRSGNDQMKRKMTHRDKERGAAVLSRDARKSPEVAGADRHSETGDDQAPSR